MSRIKCTGITVPMGKEGIAAGDLVKKVNLTGVGRYDEKNPLGKLTISEVSSKWSNYQSQQLLMVSDREIVDGERVYEPENGVHEGMSGCVLLNCKRIEAAHPLIEGVPKISPEFLAKWCENPNGDIMMEMRECVKCTCEVNILICHDNGCQNKIPRLDPNGFVVLEMESDVLSKIDAITDKQIDDFIERHKYCCQPQPAEPVHLGDNTAVNSGKIIHFEQPAPLTKTPLQMIVDEMSKYTWGKYDTASVVNGFAPHMRQFAEVFFNAGKKHSMTILGRELLSVGTPSPDFDTLYKQYEI